MRYEFYGELIVLSKTCKKCGATLEEASQLCNHCGTKVVEDKQINEEKLQGKYSIIGEADNGNKRVEVVCPYCGSNKVARDSKNEYGCFAAILAALVVLFVGDFLFESASMLIVVIVATIVGKSTACAFQDKEDKTGIWNIRCETCGKYFYINKPNGDNTITNLKN